MKRGGSGRRELIELPEKLVLDTSVLVEYVVANSPYRPIIEDLFHRSRDHRVTLYVNTVSLAETYYVVSRIYRATGLDVEEANEEALKYILFVSRRVEIVKLDIETAILASEYKKRLRIALPDCIVIATATRTNSHPLFKSVEREMKPLIKELRKLKTIFLEEVLEQNL